MTASGRGVDVVTKDRESLILKLPLGIPRQEGSEGGRTLTPLVKDARDGSKRVNGEFGNSEGSERRELVEVVIKSCISIIQTSILFEIICIILAHSRCVY